MVLCMLKRSGLQFPRLAFSFAQASLSVFLKCPTSPILFLGGLQERNNYTQKEVLVRYKTAYLLLQLIFFKKTDMQITFLTVS